MSTNQPRKPFGTPAGGQWAPAQHAEADVDLGPATTGPATTGPAMSGPAMTELPDGSREWCQRGKLHRTDGPATDGAVSTIGKVSVGQEVSYIERGKAVLGFHCVATVERRAGIGYVLHCEDGFTVEGGSATKVFVR